MKKRSIKTAKNPTGERRYPEDQFSEYHSEYNLRVKKSPILNKNARNLMDTNSWSVQNLDGCRNLLIQLEGGKDQPGYYKGAYEKWYRAFISGAKEELAKVHKQFKVWTKDQIRKGLALKEPDKWPNDLLLKRLRAEAALDVYRKEKATVELQIEYLTEAARKKQKEQMLPNGTLGKITEQGDKIVSVDGQPVSYSVDGIPFIDAPDSPYHKMSVFDYRKMAEKWKEEKELTMEQLRKKRDEIFKQKKIEAVLNDEMPPEKMGKDLVVTASRLPQWMDRLGITKDKWPEWPESAESVK